MVQYDWRVCPNPALAIQAPDYGPMASDLGPRRVFQHGPGYPSGGDAIGAPCSPNLLTIALAFGAGMFLAGGPKRRKR